MPDPSHGERAEQFAGATIGPTVWDLEGPTPTLKISKTLFALSDISSQRPIVRIRDRTVVNNAGDDPGGRIGMPAE
jgi:hypothetical protein